VSSNFGYSLDPSYKALLATVGVSHEEILRRAGLPDDLLNQPGVRISTEQFFAFARAIEETVDDPTFPITLADSVGAEAFSPPLFAALCSPNLTIALTRLSRFKPLLAPVRIGVESDETGLHITFGWLESDLGPPPYLIGSEPLFVVKLARMGTRHHVRPTEVGLPVLPPSQPDYEAFLGCRIERSDELRMSFSVDDATRPFVTNNDGMWQIFEPQLRQRLADLEGSASFEARTRSVLMEALPSGQASVDIVASRLAVSPRTLQRRLQEEGTSFKAVVRNIRERLSRHDLGTTRLSSNEIAYLLGFEEPNSFYRAFHNWTGTTPEALRQSLQPRPA
jgi:AraC-like DNA-binding protein